ncbi:MAG: two-component system, OmpR family, phosphate regulon sensor histidine kinase PhoR [Parcubacteria group bacterium LiPW_41]|nr:MAG: two-component system, OmpR family, phosphate regulon sensor histidine kinase PhoR [Parcubacteria group bacterium LiPW_41]
MVNIKLPKVTLRTRLISVTLLAVLFFNTVVGILLYLNISSGFRDYAKEEMIREANERAYEVSSVLDETRTKIEYVAQSDTVREFFHEKKNTIEVEKLFSLLNLNEEYLTLSLFDKNGTVLLSTESTILGKNFAFRDYFRKAIVGTQNTDVLISSVDNSLGFFHAVPVYSDTKEIVGVFLARIQTKKVLSKVYEVNVLSTQGKKHVLLLDEFGVIISSDNPEQIFRTVGTPSKNIEILIQKKWGPMGIDATPISNFSESRSVIENYKEVESFTSKSGSDSYLTSIVGIPNSNLFLLFASSDTVIGSAIQRLTNPLILYIVLLVVFLSLMLFLIIDEFLKPLVRIKSFINSVSQGDVNSALDVSLIDDNEFKELGGELNEMVESIRGFQTKLEDRVKEKTKELDDRIKELETTKRSMINVLEDLEQSKTRVEIQQAQTTAVLESVEHAVVVVDPEGKITFINEVARKMFGFGTASGISTKLSDFIHVHDFSGVEISLEEYLLKRAIQEGKSSILRSYISQKNEVMFPAFSVFAPIVFQNGIIGAVAVVRDITEEKKLEDVRISFISTAAHQLRTPLTAISWFSEMLLDEMQNETKTDEKEMASQIHRSVKRMIDFVNMLLQVARVEAGRLRVVPVLCDLEVITQEVVQAITPLIPKEDKKEIQVRSLLVSHLNVLIDKEIYWQVIQNFLTNAIRYSDKNSVITITFERKKDMIECSIHNFGIGIPEKEKGKIFQRFYRASNAIKTVPEGSGLGLALVKLLVEDWGGSVWFESNKNDGTVFIFTIPVSGMKERNGEIGLKV